MPSNSLVNNPRCPRCNRAGQPAGHGLFNCPGGCGFFDSDPDEGGSHYADPSKRAELADESRARRFPARRKRVETDLANE